MTPSEACARRVQQKLSHARVQLNLAATVSGVQNQLALIEGAALHLRVAMSAHLQELAHYLALPDAAGVVRLDDFARHQQAKGIAEQLRGTSWFVDMAAWERGMYQVPQPQSQAANNMIASDAAKPAADLLSLERVELWWQGMSHFVEQKRAFFAES